MVRAWLAAALLLLGLAGCPGGGVELYEPYTGCPPHGPCYNGLVCTPTTLPPSDYRGDVCTQACTVDTDCPRLLTFYAPACVDGQCYTQCSGDGGCPYEPRCLSVTNGDAGTARICSP